MVILRQIFHAPCTAQRTHRVFVRGSPEGLEETVRCFEDVVSAGEAVAGEQSGRHHRLRRMTDVEGFAHGSERSLEPETLGRGSAQSVEGLLLSFFFPQQI